MIISLKNAHEKLGIDTRICLEPEEAMQAKQAAGKEDELWAFDLAHGRIARGDGKFHDARVMDRGGWHQVVLYEEPNVPVKDDGSRDFIGTVLVERNRNGRIAVRQGKGVNGPILEAAPSSVSKGATADGVPTVGEVQFNPQRIVGLARVAYREADFPDDEGMTVAEFAAKSTDARSLAAVLKVLAHLNLI